MLMLQELATAIQSKFSLNKDELLAFNDFLKKCEEEARGNFQAYFEIINYLVDLRPGLGHLDVVKFFLTTPLVDEPMMKLQLFIWAAVGGYLDVVKHLYPLMEDPTQPLVDYSAIGWAASVGNLEIVKFLAMKASMEELYNAMNAAVFIPGYQHTGPHYAVIDTLFVLFYKLFNNPELSEQERETLLNSYVKLSAEEAKNIIEVFTWTFCSEFNEEKLYKEALSRITEKVNYMREIVKNSESLFEGYHNTRYLFSILPIDKLPIISSLMGKENDRIEHDPLAVALANQCFFSSNPEVSIKTFIPVSFFERLPFEKPVLIHSVGKPIEAYFLDKQDRSVREDIEAYFDDYEDRDDESNGGGPRPV